jgi:hypothetical protein
VPVLKNDIRACHAQLGFGELTSNDLRTGIAWPTSVAPIIGEACVSGLNLKKARNVRKPQHR